MQVFISICRLSLIWAGKYLLKSLACDLLISQISTVRPNNLGGLFAIMTIMGILSLTLLPLSLELACEICRDAETSSATLWFW